MNATQMKHKAAMEQWKQRILECRASGLTVKAWCAHYGYHYTTYYRWEKELFGQIQESTEDTGLTVQSAAMPVTAEQELVELPVAESPAPIMAKPTAVKAEPAFRPVAVVHAGGLEVSLTNEVSPKLMKYLKELLPHAE